MFDDFFSNGGRHLSPPPSVEGFGSYLPSFDLSETDKHIDLIVGILGMTDKDIKVNLSEDGEILIFEGDKFTEGRRKNRAYATKKGTAVSFSGLSRCPASRMDKQVEAICKNGVLKVHLPKLPEQRQDVRKIPVESA